MKKSFLPILLLYSAINSCTDSTDYSSIQSEKTHVYSVMEEPYEYGDELKRYFKDLFNYEITKIESGFVFFIPVNSCSPCVEKTILGLNNLTEKKNIDKIIIVGTSSDSLINKNIKTLKENYVTQTLIDNNSRLFKYELNIGGPTILIFENHSPKYQLNLSEESWIQKKKYLPFLI
jgi:hypothetical protein